MLIWYLRLNILSSCISMFHSRKNGSQRQYPVRRTFFGLSAVFSPSAILNGKVTGGFILGEEMRKRNPQLSKIKSLTLISQLTPRHSTSGY